MMMMEVVGVDRVSGALWSFLLHVKDDEDDNGGSEDTFKIYKFDFEGDKHPRADSETDPCDHY